MDQQKHTVFMLKYTGKSYEEIAKVEGIGLAATTLQGYLAPSGEWAAEYKEFCRERNKQVENEVDSIFKGVAQLAANSMTEALKDAVRYVLLLREQLENWKEGAKGRLALEKDLRIANEKLINLSEKILDRSGLAVIRRMESEEITRDIDNKDEIDNILKQAGIDPESVVYQDKAPAREKRAVQA